jgi:hypothetical protein
MQSTQIDVKEDSYFVDNQWRERGPTPPATDRTAQMESRQVGISYC